MLAATFGFIGTLLGVFRAWPQVRKTLLDGQTDAVSVPTWVLTLMNNSAWLTLGVMISSTAVSISNLISATGCVAVLIAVARTRGVPRAWSTYLLGLLGAGIIVATAIAGQSALTVLANGFAIAMFLPQLLTVVRSSAVGVSTLTWGLTAASSAVWVGYAFAIDRPALAACHVVIFPAAVVIATKALRAPAKLPEEDAEMAAA